MVSELVRRLIQMQQEDGLTDEAFAARLGVHRVMWSLVRRGKRQPGKRVIEGAFRLNRTLADVHAQSLQIATRSGTETQQPVEAAL
jgi:transcriptional regulator with XRE-family HTH domain